MKITEKISDIINTITDIQRRASYNKSTVGKGIVCAETGEELEVFD